MNRGPLKLRRDELHWLPLLTTAYRIEAARASGPGCDHRTLDDVLWSQQELAERAAAEDQRRIPEFLDWMESQRQLLRIPANGDHPERYVTRTAETVRLLGHAYEYWEDAGPTIDAVRWLVEEKRVPQRTIPLPEAKATLLKELGSSGFKDLEMMEQVLDDAFKGLQALVPGEFLASQFQLDSWTRILTSEFGTDERQQPHHVLVADVGAGKTFAFGFPAVVAAMYYQAIGQQCTQILLYPRTALAKDQHEGLSKLVAKIRSGRPSLHLEHKSAYKKRGDSVKQGVNKTYAVAPPELIVTTLETLKRRLANPKFANAVAGRVKRIIFDEIHLVDGLTGTNIINVIGRLRALDEGTIHWEGVSATVAVPDEHAAKVFGVNPADVEIVRPAVEDMQAVGVVHHVFLRPIQGVSTLGALVNTTSLTVHSRRSNLGDRRAGAPRTICFADNLEALGRWNADFRENERTEQLYTGARQHPTTDDVEQWIPTQREIPYALRYQSPLQRRLEASGGKPTKKGSGGPYRDLRAKLPCQDVCNKCRGGEQLTIGTLTDRDDIRDLGRLVYRYPPQETDLNAPFEIQNPVFEQDTLEVGTLSKCPFLQAGACTWFVDDDFTAESIPHTQQYDWNNAARSTIHSSKHQSEADEEGGATSGEIVFSASVEDAYGIRVKNKMLPVDVVFASPSLEVGIDLDNVADEVLFKAIRNIASYRQKAGRGGREEGTDTMIVSLLTQRPVDKHYYRQPQKLVRSGRVEPVPLKANNQPLLKSAAYMATWDALAIANASPEVINPHKAGDGYAYTQMVQKAHVFLKDQSARVRAHVQRATGFMLDTPQVTAALQQVEEELAFLLQPLPDYFDAPGLDLVADLLPNGIAHGAYSVRTTDALRDPLEGADEACKLLRKISSALPVRLDKAAKAVQLISKISVGVVTKRAIEELDDLLSQVFDEEEIRFKLRKDARRAIEDLSDALEESGQDSLEAFFFYKQLDELPTWNKHYLTTAIQNLPVMVARKNDAYSVYLQNLFTNPYEQDVEVHVHYGEKLVRKEIVPVSEALFGFLPASWTFRLGNSAHKVLAQDIRTGPNGLICELKPSIPVHDFITERRGVRGPPWVPDALDVIRPTQISVRAFGDKYVPVAMDSGVALDNDEAKRASDESSRVKIPQTYQERWVHIEAEEGSRIMVADRYLSQIKVQRNGKDLPASEIRGEIQHPLAKALMDDFRWHENLEVTEFTHATSRSFSSRKVKGVTIRFEQEKRPVALGQTIPTEGFSMDLRGEATDGIIQGLLSGLQSDDEAHGPTALKAIGAHLLMASRHTDTEGLDAFSIDKVLGLACYILWKDNQTISLNSLASTVKSIAVSPELEAICSDFQDGEQEQLAEEAKDEGGEFVEDAAKEVQGLAKNVRLASTLLDGLEESLEPWLRLTLLNTLGIATIQAMQRFTGTPDDKLGYLPDLDGIDEGKMRLYVYDRDPFGNGASKLVEQFSHILGIQREAGNQRDVFLPTEDFLTVLEQELLQCPQFHTDLDALHRIEANEGQPGYAYVREYAEEVTHIGATTWKKLGVNGPRDAWKLPIFHRIHQQVARRTGLAADDVYRATSSCWSGCPECVVVDNQLMGPIAGMYYSDKSILDDWYAALTNGQDAYDHIDLNAVALGGGAGHVGEMTAVAIERNKSLVRATRLPYTLGIVANRTSPNDPPSLMIRSGDIDGQAIPGAGAGLSTGLPHLISFHLLTAAFLAAIGILPEERRKVKLVYYDIRDLPVDDSSVSTRMISALEAVGGKATSVRNLSDLLGLMHDLGFDITLCVDHDRTMENAVAHFLDAVKQRAPGARILCKSIPYASMHAKCLIAPLGAMHGSANMTKSGTSSNDELYSHEPYGSPQYQGIVQSIEDKLTGAKPYQAIQLA